jgi:HK97 family phage portal protein
MPLIASEGQLTRIEQPVNPSNAWWWGGRVKLNDRWTDYAAIWRTQPNVRTVISFLGRNIAQIALKVYRREADNIRQQLNDHPLAATLKRPNDFTTQYRLFDALVQSIALYDNALWAKLRNGNNVGLAMLPWSRVQLVGDNFLVPDTYRITGNKGSVDLPRDRAVHFRGFNPEDPREGVSPMETLRRILNEEAAAGEARENFWRNDARSSVWLQRPLGAKWSPEAKQRFRAQWRAFYQGTANAGETPVLEDGMEAKEWPSATARDSQFIEARKLTREEVAAAFHIPPPMVGILDHATFSNIDTQHRMLYQDTLGPWLTMIEQEIELQLLPEYADTTNVYVEFNLAEKLKGSFEEQAKNFQTAVGGPWMLRDEARARVNLPPLPGGAGAELITPMNVTEGGLASPTDTAPPPKALPAELAVIEQQEHEIAEARETLAGYFDRLSRSALSLIGADPKTALDKLLLRERWDLELQPMLESIGSPFTAQEINSALGSALQDAMRATKPLKAARDVFQQAKTVWAESLARSAP